MKKFRREGKNVSRGQWGAQTTESESNKINFTAIVVTFTIAREVKLLPIN
jgi:hypothetical protein